MKYLLYCIFQHDPHEPLEAPGIRVVTSYGLDAVVSGVEEPTSAPKVSSLLAYESVVGAIHARRTVIPLRYGCLMESEREIVLLLQDHRQHYEALLGRLHGMTEMGIRFLRPASAVPFLGLPPSPGAAYLASLRNRYNLQDTLAPEEIKLADRIAGLLASGSTDQRREISSSGQGRLLSLYFLIPKSRTEEFRKKAREISPSPGVKLLLSGPWPPYNFVVSS